MKIILKKVRKGTPFSWINPIKVEPLELEYLKAVIDDLGISMGMDMSLGIDSEIDSDANLHPDLMLNVESMIADDLYYREEVIGDIIVLNGYNTARDQMMLEAKQIKSKSPNTIVIGSGVDVQINWSLYVVSDFDFLVISNRLYDFKSLIEHILLEKQVNIKGVLNLKEKRHVKETLSLKDILPLKGISSLYDKNACVGHEALTVFEDIKPSRSYFEQIKSQTRYLLYEHVALVKRSHGCPYGCEFCFCKQLNQGQFVSRSYEDLKIEMESIKADYYWVVDDVFIHNEGEAKAFIEAFKEMSFKMIVYLRADFIVKHSELMAKLKEAGIIEVIVGFESIKASFLEDFNKGYTVDINAKAIATLKHVDLSFTALFMVDISDDYKDFKALKAYIRQHQIQNYTFSIFTPLRGTDLYKNYEKDIMDYRCEHYDFLHLVLKPLKMHSVTFKMAFIELFVFQFCHSKSARQLIYKLIKDNLRNGFKR